MLKGLRSNPALPDYTQWDRDLRFPYQSENKYKELQTFNEQFWVLRPTTPMGKIRFPFTEQYFGQCNQ